MWYVYLLLCDQKTFYAGITTNIPERLRQRRDKLSIHTKRFSDLRLMYCEKYISKYDAARREKQIKGWSHAKKLKLIKGELGINTCTEFVEVAL